MRLLPFKPSAAVSIGTELEFQIIHPETYALASRAKNLITEIRKMSNDKYQDKQLLSLVKPEITQSMIEINSSVHTTPETLFLELNALWDALQTAGRETNVLFCGGGSHPFHRWTHEKIFPTPRYRQLYREYRFLSRRCTVFGQHIHIGCPSADDAIYLVHALSRYVPHLIAISASSPFYEGMDTGHASSRITVFSAFPMSGVMPWLTDWKAFSEYFYRMRRFGIISTMKDFYWDIRPKPEFGTVEIRVCDTPLTLGKAMELTVYLAALSSWILEKRPIKISEDLYYVYNYNRFQASRYGFDGVVIDSEHSRYRPISEDITDTLMNLSPQTDKAFRPWLQKLAREVEHKENDATWLRKQYAEFQSLPEVVKAQCNRWIMQNE